MGIKKKPTTNYDDPVNYSAGEYNAVTPTLSDGDVVSFQFDSGGNLLTKQVNAGSGSNPAAGATASAVPADADYQGVSVGGTLTGVTGLSVGTKVAPTVAIVDASGNQITAFGGSGGNAAAGATGAAVPADADYTGFNSGGNLVGVSSANPLPVSLANTAANATAVKVDNSGVTQPISAASLPLPSGAATSAKQPALGTAGTASSDVITIQGIASMTAVKVDGSAVTQPVSGTFFQATQPVSIAATVVVKADTAGNQANALKVDGSAVTQPVSGTVTVGNATLAVTESGTWTVQPGNTANTTPWLVQDVGQASGGMSFFTASLTSTKSQVKGSAGTIYGITAVNNGSTLAYIQVFNKLSANVTVGTTAPDYVVPVPAPSSGTAGAGIREEYAKGLSFGTGITVACTTTRTGSTSATCDVNVNYI